MTENKKDTPKTEEKLAEVENGHPIPEESSVQKPSIVKKTGNDAIQINDIPYTIVENHRDAFQTEELDKRYSDVLDKYDYIVADISDGKARLKGFYRDSYKKAPAELRISFLEDYLTEYCNFGCPYYVLARADGKKGVHSKANKKRSRNENRRKPVKAAKAQPGRKRSEQTTPKTTKQERYSKKQSFETKEVDQKENLPTTDRTKRVKTVKDDKGKPRFHIRKKEAGE